MSNEAIFNKEAAYIIGINVEKKAVKAIQRYMKEKSRGGTYYDAFECLGYKIGVAYIVIETVNPRTGKVTGYWPAIEYQKGNAVDGRARIVKFMQAPYKSSSLCYGYIARKFVHTLIDDVPNLEELIFGKCVAEMA